MKTFKDYFAEKKITGKTSVDEKHSHAYTVDAEGDGKTTSTEPKSHPDHVHEIKSAEVIAAGKKKHTHTLKTAK